jgi:hypothetical protein
MYVAGLQPCRLEGLQDCTASILQVHGETVSAKAMNAWQKLKVRHFFW